MAIFTNFAICFFRQLKCAHISCPFLSEKHSILVLKAFDILLFSVNSWKTALTGLCESCIENRLLNLASRSCSL